MRSIRGRLLLLLLAGLAIVLSAGGAAVYLIARASLHRQFDAALLARANTLASLVKLEPEGLIFEISDAPPATLAETYFELRAQTGRVLKRSTNLGSTPLPSTHAGGQATAIEDVGLPDGIYVRAMWLQFRPRLDPDDWAGHDSSQAAPELLTLVAALDRRSMDRALATILASLLVAGAAVGIAVTGLLIIGVPWGLAPLSLLGRRIGGIRDATPSIQLDGADAPRELEPIYRELNALLDRVGQALERERSFAIAAAHELRTPLAELWSTAEIALRYPEAGRSEAALNSALSIARNMATLVESLLLVGRANAGALDLGDRNDPAAVSTIVRECLDRSAEVIRAKSLRVAIQLNGHHPLRVPARALGIIVGNLIDNAVRYTPAEGSICVSDEHASETAGSAILTVENGPVDLQEHDLVRLFQPFWRSDLARTDRQHLGLGLTVVERMARAIGLRVEARLAGGRLQMRLEATGITRAV